MDKRKARIRPLRTLADFEACVEIQRIVWKHADLDIIPVHQFCVSAATGGILLGVFSGAALAGYVYSFPAVLGRKHTQHSHHLAVRPEFQGDGLGKALKWAQRAEALARGYDLITWTYDPLQSRNANLNFHTLGVRSRTYLDNFYGETPSLALEEGLPTDRLLVEWPIASKRVEDHAQLRFEPPASGDAHRVVEARPSGVYPDISPLRPLFGRREKILLVEVPRAIRDLKGREGRIAAWQKAVRAALIHYFRAGYVLDDFLFSERAFYVLRREGK